MVQKDELLRLAVMAADEYDIKREWLFSLIKIESNWDYMAVRFESKWKYHFKSEYFANLNKITHDTEKILQSMSWGLGQVMGTVAREYDHKGSLLELAHPQLGLRFACLKFRSLITKFGYTHDAIAAYNAGSPIRNQGVYVNQSYVDKFNKTLNGVIV